jgi:hypothetical protein
VTAALIFLSVSQYAEALEGYVCLAEHVAGVTFDKVTGQWSGTVFRPQNKFVITRARSLFPDTSAAWVVRTIPEAPNPAFCQADFNEKGRLFCKGLGIEFKFNRNTGRFLVARLIGYYSDVPGVKDDLFGPEGSNEPSVAIGLCSPL